MNDHHITDVLRKLAEEYDEKLKRYADYRISLLAAVVMLERGERVELEVDDE